MTGLIVKGCTALFIKGPDPGRHVAVALVDQYRSGGFEAWSNRLAELNLAHTQMPASFSRGALAWGYVFDEVAEHDNRRLEPGPFGPELTDVVNAIEIEQRKSVEGNTQTSATGGEDLVLGDQGQSGANARHGAGKK